MMKQRIQTILVWTGFLGSCVWMGLNSEVFENRVANLFYEVGVILFLTVAGVAILVGTLRTVGARSKRTPAAFVWVLLLFLIAGMVFVKIELDATLRKSASAGLILN